ncbi:MAG TPA: hypothetical protein VJN01_05750 [Xanthomonadales bacterium]|nr:hypothetical protein [Xanthomonadales bacterium]
MAVENDHIAELLGAQAPVDESTLPDSGTTDADLEGEPSGETAEYVATDEHGEAPPARKTVPLGALQEERQRRKELQDQLNQQAELNQRMQQRFEQMMGHMQQPQQVTQQPVEIPQFVDDPEGHVKALTEQFQQQIAQLRQHYEGNVQQQQAAAAGQQLAQRTAAAEQEFVAAQPDYPHAAEYFMQRKAAEYLALGADPVTIQQQLARDYQNLAVVAAQRGQNPAQMLYNLSKAMGYTPAAAGQQGAPQGQQRPAAKAPTSLSGIGGAGRSPEESTGLTLESIANMTDAEFDKVWKQMSRNSKQAPKI